MLQTYFPCELLLAMKNCNFCYQTGFLVPYVTIINTILNLFQELPETVLLKFFRPENTPVPTRPTPEQLSNLIKTSLHYPESFNHSFHQKRLVKHYLQKLQKYCYLDINPLERCSVGYDIEVQYAIVKYCSIFKFIT